MICVLVVWKGFARFCSDVSESVSMSICVLFGGVFIANVNAFLLLLILLFGLSVFLSVMYLC